MRIAAAYILGTVLYVVVVLPIVMFSMLLVVLVYVGSSYVQTINLIKAMLGIDIHPKCDYNVSNRTAIYEEKEDE